MKNSADIYNSASCAIIMQGAILSDGKLDHNVIKNIIKVRKYFPDNQILVSSWKIDEANTMLINKIARYFNFDIIYNDDPGPLIYKIRNINYTCNINRMIVSTINALDYTDKVFSIKIRTDSFFSKAAINDILASYYNCKRKILLRDDTYKVFSERLINGNLFARNPTSYIPYLFHPGDIFLAGFTSDMKLFFSAPHATKTIFEISKNKHLFSLMRYVPEQYLWVKCILRKTAILPFDGNRNYDNNLLNESERYYVNNFYLLEESESFFSWPKYKSHYNSKGKYSLYNKDDWYYLYNKHILSHSFNDKGRLKRKFTITIMRFFYKMRIFLLKKEFVRALAVAIFTKRK